MVYLQNATAVSMHGCFVFVLRCLVYPSISEHCEFYLSFSLGICVCVCVCFNCGLSCSAKSTEKSKNSNEKSLLTEPNPTASIISVVNHNFRLFCTLVYDFFRWMPWKKYSWHTNQRVHHLQQCNVIQKKNLKSDFLHAPFPYFNLLYILVMPISLHVFYVKKQKEVHAHVPVRVLCLTLLKEFYE